MTRDVGDSRSGHLGVVTSGSRVDDPAALLFGGALDSLLDLLGGLDYDYVIFDGPPLLGVADGHALAQRADALLMAARLEKLNIDHALESRSILDRLGAHAIGLIVGVRWQQSAYAYSYSYAHERAGTPYRSRSAANATKPLRRPWRRRDAAHRADPDKRRNEPEVAPVERVDERTVGDHAAPGTRSAPELTP